MAINVAIIGTGDYARALALRLLRHGMLVKFYSRSPQKNRLTSRISELAEVAVVGWNDTFNDADFVIVAVPGHAYKSLAKLAASLTNRIVVDVSNSANPDAAGKSNAEILQEILPQSHVIKAFNSISAYTLESEVSGESRTVLVCGSDTAARQSVAQLARELGFAAVESGGLRQARDLERAQRAVCAEWIKPMIVFGGMMVLWTVYIYLRYFVLRKTGYTWHRFPTNVMNKIFGAVSLNLLGLVYLPACLAAILQLVRGTKYRPFPFWLDEWMKMRKQLGILALFTGWLHVLMSITILNPAYFSKWFITKEVIIKINGTANITVPHDSRMNLNGELNVFFGLLGAVLMVIPGIASIPAVGALLNWQEWRLVQSFIGLSSLVFSTTHVTIKGAYDWRFMYFKDIVQSTSFLSSFLPWVCVSIILTLWLPCFYIPLKRIRSGWERGLSSPEDDEENEDVSSDRPKDASFSNGNYTLTTSADSSV